MSISLVELTDHGSGTTDPVGWRGVDFLADWDLDHDDEVGGLTGGRQHSSSLACLVDRARVFFWVWFVTLVWLEVNQWHLVVKFGL